MTERSTDVDDRMRAFTERLIRFETTAGNERPAQEWLRDRLDDLGFETYTWTADAATLASHPSFPSAGDRDVDEFDRDVDELDRHELDRHEPDHYEPDVEDRPSVAGVLEFGDPDRGRTLVLNGHVDVVPAASTGWTGDPFEPRRDGDRLVGRGAVDMKSQVAACVFAARQLADRVESGEIDAVGGEGDRDGLDGRLVVECVAGEEDGGIGAAAATLANPYPFERDAAVVTEPTDGRVVTATAGCLMAEIGIEGRPAHAARRWRGESVLPHFERVRNALDGLEADRAERVTHPLFERFETPWPIVVGRVDAGTWASNVPGTLTAGVRIGVAPGESLDDVERECRETLDELAADDEWTVSPPTFERAGAQFAPCEIVPTEGGPTGRVVAALQDAMGTSGADSAETAPVGETYGSDARHYVQAGIPAVVFGPGRIEEAHFPDESVHWPDVLRARDVLTDTARRFLAA